MDIVEADAATEPDEHEEIEPTQKMVLAGVSALLSTDTRVDSPESVVEAVWEAMNSARKQ